MNVEHTAGMIDYLCDQYGVGDAAARALMLGYLQVAEQEVWGMHEWWWRQREEAQPVVAGTKLYSVAVSLGGGQGTSLVTLLDGTRTPLTFVEPNTFGRLLRPSVVTGTPQFWTTEVWEGLGTMRFELWPVPSADGAVSAVLAEGPAVLADATSSVSRVPRGYRSGLVYAAEVQLRRKQGQVEQEQLAQQAADKVWAGMLAQDGREMTYRR